MPVKITEAMLKQAIAEAVPKGRAYDVIDAACPGLIMRVGPKGVRFAFKIETGGTTHRLTFGSPPDIRPDRGSVAGERGSEQARETGAAFRRERSGSSRS